MAWRIEESVIRGEIDNRTRGCVAGRIWLAGRAEPVELRLSGDCWRDLAGRRLEFTNPEPKPGDFASLAALQQGAVGDITASRKVKVPEIPMDQIGEYYAARKPWPWHWGNSLYLEWFSERNGRVVIESAGYELKIVGDTTWEMTPDEEEQQRRTNGEAITGFMERLGEAAQAGAEPAEGDLADERKGPEEEEPAAWNNPPQSEEEAEQIHAESDRLVDRILARMAREGEGADYAKIMAEEIERTRRERGEPEPTPEQLTRHDEWITQMHRAAREAADDPEVQREMLERKHPLAAKAQDLSSRMMNEPEENGWLTETDGEEHPVAELLDSVFKAGAKLAGALNGQDWPPELEFCASTIVRLKKARVYLDDALRAMESCQEQKLVPNDWLAVVLVEVVDLAHDADILIAELRERLERRAE